MNMSSKPVVPSATNPELESKGAKPRRELNTPKPKQTKAIERHLNGESARKISRRRITKSLRSKEPKMTKFASKPVQIPSPRGSYKPIPLQNRVIERHMNGESDRNIGRAEGIDRGTAKRIRSKPEIVQIVAEAQSRVADAIPDAAENVVSVVRSGDLRFSLPTSMTVLDRFGALPKNGIEVPKPEQDREERFLIELGRITMMASTKARKYGSKLPPGMEGLEEEARRIMEEDSPGTEPKS
jgi:hypothetical protein